MVKIKVDTTPHFYQSQFLNHFQKKFVKLFCCIESGDGTLIPFIKEGAPAINTTVTKILEVGKKATIGCFSPASSTDGKVIIKYLVANIPVQRDQIFHKEIELNVKKD